MKKRPFATLFLCIALVFALSIAALAADTVEYESSELGLSFSAPADFKIVSRDSYETDPVVDELPYTMENLDRWFTGDGDCYFLGTSDPMRCVFSLRAYPNGRDHFVSAVEDGALDILMDTMADLFAKDGAEVLSKETYPHPENTILRFGYLNPADDGTTDYKVSFFTACGENSIRIDFCFMFSSGTPEEDTLANSVMDSMKFSAAVPKPSSQTGSVKTIVCCVLLAAVVIVLYILSRKMRKDKEAAAQAMASDALSSVPAAPKPQTAVPDTKYCPYCGKKIPAASKFCPKCGAQLPPRDEK